MMNEEGDQMRCGFCMEKLQNAIQPKQLPCSHGYCLSCLLADCKKTCPTCKQAWAGTSAETLQPYLTLNANSSVDSDVSVPCDSCKSEVKQKAHVYCTKCEKSFCEKHELGHDDLFDLEHDKISVTTYLSCQSAYKKKKCIEHSSEIVTIACGVCHTMFCRKCDMNTECEGDWQEHDGDLSRGKSTAGLDMNVHLCTSAPLFTLGVVTSTTRRHSGRSYTHATRCLCTIPSSSSSQKHHEFLPITELVRDAEDVLRSKLAAIATRRTAVFREEKEAWRLIDDISTQAEIMKKGIDESIKKRCDTLHQLGCKFKQEIDEDAEKAGTEAATYSNKMDTQNRELLKMESELSSQIGKQSNSIDLLEILHKNKAALNAIPSTPVDRFTYQQKTLRSIFASQKQKKQQRSSKW